MHRRLGPLLGGLATGCLLLFLVLLADGWLERLALDEAGARAHDEVLGLSGRVAAADFLVPIDAERLVHVQERLDPLLTGLTQPGSGILRVNLISVDGTVVYSDRPQLRGTVLPIEEHHRLSEALSGSVSSERSSLQSDENRDLHARYNSAIEVYVPVRIDGHVVGAYELYQDSGLLRATELLLWLGVAAILALALMLATLLQAGQVNRETPVAAPAGQVGVVAPATESVRLTPRELQVLRLMPDHTTRDIAYELVLSEETVRTHIKSILHKLKCSSRASAVLAAVRLGMLELLE